ncbi:TonB-dependent siderophore receptor [Xanthomonas campestris]|uniref:TonB-dependent siderophore receptor n=1 Tax=Xanthomonas campestris TaxID=339 RepID=UPI002161D068|nr:TonB-dependent receptor [Xanthomonas campestris]MEA9844611.1 TonB-dependent receptor [Xanthomonas campestris pv. raphani]
MRGRVVGAYTEKDSWVRFQQDRSPSVYGVLEADLTDSTRLRAGIDHLATHSDGGAWSAAPLFFSDGTPARLPRSYSAAARWNRWERESTNVFATLEQQLAGGWSGRLAYNHRATDTDSLLFAGSNSASFADARTGLGLRVSDTYGVSETRENALDLYASGPFQWLGRAHELVVGANHYDRELGTLRTAITARPYSLTAFPSIFDWNGDVGRPTTTNAGIPSSITNTQETGYYAAVRLNPTDALKLIGGARYSSWNTATDNYSPANQFAGRSADYDANALTPYLGAIYDLSRHLSAFVSYSDVFQAQNLRDRTNQQLDPVVGANLEYGFKGEFFGGALYAALNGFTYAYSTDQRGARVFTTSPMHLARFNTTYRFGDWTLGGGISWQSAVYQNQTIPTGRFTAAGAPITRSGRVTQGGYLLVDLMGRYRINEQLSVGVTVTNLFDKVYYRNVGFFNSGYWGEPRRLLFNLRANF